MISRTKRTQVTEQYLLQQMTSWKRTIPRTWSKYCDLTQRSVAQQALASEEFFFNPLSQSQNKNYQLIYAKEKFRNLEQEREGKPKQVVNIAIPHVSF